MMTGASRFYNSIKSVGNVTQGDLIDLFVYYLAVEAAEPVVTPALVKQCFVECDIPPPTRIPAHLSEGVRSRPVRVVRATANGVSGYKLERHYREHLSKKLGAERIVVQTSVELRRLETALPPGPKRNFLTETINCFEAGADRATIVMCWILVIDHLFDHVFTYGLPAFNAALAKNPDKRVKVITTREDFTELPESKFIELSRAAGIISNDVRKILDEKLGTRNSAAHPSGIVVKRSKVIDFVEDLILLKFPA
jgi:hypothetical protein